MKEIKIIPMSEARDEIIDIITSKFDIKGSLDWGRCMTMDWRGVPYSTGWAVCLKDFNTIIPKRLYIRYKTFRGAKTAMRNMKKAFFKVNQYSIPSII